MTGANELSRINLITRNGFYVCSSLNFFFNLDIFDARPREIHYHLQTEARSLMISFSQYVA